MTSLDHLLVEMKIAEQQSLLILLHKDGTINRMGNGTTQIDKNFFIGITETVGMLQELVGLITTDFEAALNKVFDLPEKKGDVCSLEIVMADEKETKGIKFIYGIKSVGPPQEIKDFVLRAIELTNPWFQQQQKIAPKPAKKWWQFWK
jgi:hypothetical protein